MFLVASARMPEPAVPSPSPSALRRSILVHLRRTGPSSPDAIAAALGASRSGAAQQLRALDSAGLVTRTAVRHGVGRPRHLYDVTADAQDLFPSNYDGLAAGLLAAILEVGGDALVEDVFVARRRQAGDRLAHVANRVAEGTDNLRRGVGRAVIDDDHLERWVALAENALQRLADIGFDVQCRDDHANSRLVHGKSLR